MFRNVNNRRNPVAAWLLCLIVISFLVCACLIGMTKLISSVLLLPPCFMFDCDHFLFSCVRLCDRYDEHLLVQFCFCKKKQLKMTSVNLTDQIFKARSDFSIVNSSSSQCLFVCRFYCTLFNRFTPPPNIVKNISNRTTCHNPLTTSLHFLFSARSRNARSRFYVFTTTPPTPVVVSMRGKRTSSSTCIHLTMHTHSTHLMFFSAQGAGARSRVFTRRRRRRSSSFR
jgi:hypothetical protein